MKSEGISYIFLNENVKNVVLQFSFAVRKSTKGLIIWKRADPASGLAHLPRQHFLNDYMRTKQCFFLQAGQLYSIIYFNCFNLRMLIKQFHSFFSICTCVIINTQPTCRVDPAEKQLYGKNMCRANPFAGSTRLAPSGSTRQTGWLGYI